MSQSWYDVVADCQQRVQRIRATLTSGGFLSPDLQFELDTVILAMRNYLMNRVSRLLDYDEDTVDEALLQIIEQLHRDLRSPGFSSMERRFGAYISSVTNRVLFEQRRKGAQWGALSHPMSLDALAGEDGRPYHELIEDVRPELLAEVFVEEARRAQLQAAIARLPAPDREIITLRLANVSGKDIAQRLGMSQPNVTHIYNRVVARLKRELTEGE